MRTPAIPAPTSYGFNGLNEAATSEARSQGFGTLDRLPAETLDHIVRSDPEATLRLMDTSHELEGFVIGTVLRPLYEQHGNSIHRTRRFIASALKRGKTATQIVLLSKLLSDRDTDVRGRRLVQMGVLNIRSHNALCSDLINLLCRAEAALYAFELDFPLLSTEDLRSRRRLMGELTGTGTSMVQCMDGKQRYVTGLDKVLLHFSHWFKEEDIPNLFDSQCDHGQEPSHRLILPSNSDSFAVDAGDFPDASDSSIETVASVDARHLALSMKRYMTAQMLKMLDNKAPAGQYGVLYAEMFLKSAPRKAIKILPPTPIGPGHQWGGDMFPDRLPRSADTPSRTRKACVLL